MLNTIYNFRQLTPLLATAGQPDAQELLAVCRAGYQEVINLGLADAAYALPNEQALVTGQGLGYHHLPVSFENPELERFFDFCTLYRTLSDRKCFVHCAANKRVSTFVALYRMTELGWANEAAEAEMLEVWEPTPVWRSFMEQVLERSAGN